MVHKNFFVFSIFFVFLFSTVFSATVIETPTSPENEINYAQSFAQINAKITDLSNQINAMRAQDLNAQLNSVQKADLPIIYENVSRSVQAVEQQIILDNIIIVVLAFAIMFLLIGKNMIPQNKKEPKPKEEKKESKNEQIIVPEKEQGLN